MLKIPAFGNPKNVRRNFTETTHKNNIYLDKTIPFEIHITTSDLTKSRQSDFINFCTKIDAKPLIIELSKGKFIKQPMFSKVVLSNNIDNVLFVSTQLSKSLILQNFNIERLKIEIPAENYNLFENYKSTFLKYFEWHGKIDYTQTDNLNDLCRKHKVHLSLNSLKNESNNRFITLREFGTKLEFENRVNELTKDLKKGNWTIFKQEAEYCIYDNNSFLDTGWLPQ